MFAFGGCLRNLSSPKYCSLHVDCLLPLNLKRVELNSPKRGELIDWHDPFGSHSRRKTGGRSPLSTEAPRAAHPSKRYLGDNIATSSTRSRQTVPILGHPRLHQECCVWQIGALYSAIPSPPDAPVPPLSGTFCPRQSAPGSLVAQSGPSRHCNAPIRYLALRSCSAPQ